MPLFEIEQYELHAQTYRVAAPSETQAIQRLLDGQARAVDNGLSYIEVADDFGLPADEYADLAQRLRASGVIVGDVIPSIRSIEALDDEG